jgi:hypothetical protein
MGLYSVFHQFSQAKFANGSLIISLSQLSLLQQLPKKIETHFKSGQNQLKN